MAPIIRGFLRVSTVLFAVASPILAHLILTNTVLTPSQREAVTYALIVIQAGSALSMILMRAKRPLYKIVAIGSVTAGVAVCFYHVTGGLILSSGVLHASAYSALLVLFGASLGPGSEPLITYFARKIHGQLSPEVRTYTRGVTWAWCVFFSSEILASAALFMLAPIAWWSAFVNLFNVPLIIVLFVGERLFRPLWLADPPRERIADIVRMGELVKMRLMKGKADQVLTPRQS